MTMAILPGIVEWLSRQYGYVDIDEWVVMPNHLHGILVIHDDCRAVRNVRAIRESPLRKR